MKDLEKIITYEMNEIEANAFKLCLIWEKICQKLLDNYNYSKLPKNGDPRKSHLFKCCYKLINETKNLIPFNEYKLYITANLMVLKNIHNGDIHALIDPISLCGEKAWVRWKMWKSDYDKKYNKTPVENTKINLNIIKNELEQTKKFLISKFDHYPTFSEIENSIKNKLFIKWMYLKQIHPFYVLLSPYINKLKLNKNIIPFDISIYSKMINDDLLKIFKEIFKEN